MADAEAHVVADDGPRSRGCDHQSDGELPGRTGVDGGRDEHGLAGERHSEALDAHEGEDRQVAVGREGFFGADQRQVYHRRVALPLGATGG